MTLAEKWSVSIRVKNFGKSVLTVGEAENFLQEGGIIKFHLESNKVRFAINNAVAQTAHLVISSKLLRLASSVEM